MHGTLLFIKHLHAIVNSRPNYFQTDARYEKEEGRNDDARFDMK